MKRIFKQCKRNGPNVFYLKMTKIRIDVSCINKISLQKYAERERERDSEGDGE